MGIRIDQVYEFYNKYEKSSFKEDFSLLCSSVISSFNYELLRIKEILTDILSNHVQGLKEDWLENDRKFYRIVITVDSDFDGYSSAKVVYHVLRALGIPHSRIKLIFLSSFHSGDLSNTEADYLFITDTAWGNVKFDLKRVKKILWIDHHDISLRDYLQARTKYGNKLIFLNSVKASRELAGLSCGVLVYLIFMVLIEKYLELSNQNKFFVKSSINNEVQLEALLSMYSDYSDTENYIGIMKGLYEVQSYPPLYRKLKDKFNYNNRKYFQIYISRINNLLRLERYEVLKQAILNDEDIQHREVEQAIIDRNVLIDYLGGINDVEVLNVSDNLYVALYEVPTFLNSKLVNFKGYLCSMRIPENEGFYLILCYALSENNVYKLSCRTNIFGMKKYFLRDLKFKGGGHEKAFGLEVPSERWEEFKHIIQTLRISGWNILPSNRVLNSRDIFNFEDLYKISIYNEFALEPIKISFEGSEFGDVKVETKRTVYELPRLSGHKNICIVSFELNVKQKIKAVPMLKKEVYERDIDILEK